MEFLQASGYEFIVVMTKSDKLKKKKDYKKMYEDGDLSKNDYKEKTVKSIETFFDFTLNTMNAAFNFDDNFGVTPSSLKYGFSLWNISK